MSNSYSNPKRIYYDRITDGTGTVTAHNFCLVYLNPEYAPGNGTEQFLTDSFNLLDKDSVGKTKGILIKTQLNGAMTITRPTASLEQPSVCSLILFYTPDTTGNILGGSLTYTNGENDVNIMLKGEKERANKFLDIGILDELHLSIIGVDDIRARASDPNGVPQYSQLYTLQEQTIFLKLESNSQNSNLDLLVQYQKL